MPNGLRSRHVRDRAKVFGNRPHPGNDMQLLGIQGNKICIVTVCYKPAGHVIN